MGLFTKDSSNNYPGEPRVGRIIAAIFVCVVALIFLIVGLANSPLKKTPADKIALSYGGGPFEGAKFQGIINPGSGLHFNGWFDKWVEYPVTVRNYIVSLHPSEGDRSEADAIVAPSKDGVEIKWELAVFMKLNTNLIRDFHEKLGLKYKAWTDNGWNAMLEQTVRQQLENAVQVSSKQFTADQIYTDPTVIQKVQADVANGLKDSINASVGEPFFCGPTFQLGKADCPDFQVVVKKPNLPQNVIDAFNRQKESSANIITAQNNAAADVKTAEGKAAQQKAVQNSLTPEYLEQQRIAAMSDCAKSPNCTLVMTNGGSGINVNTGK